MQIKITDFSGNLVNFELETSLPSDLLTREATFEDVVVSGWYTYMEERVAMSATVSYNATLTCDSCGEVFTKPYITTVQATFAINPDEEEYLYDGEMIDLTKPVSDSINLDFPLKVLCQDDCKGLCSGCGENLNTSSCKCHEGINTSSPFSVLMEKYSLGGADHGSTKK
ncbi:MAG: DUF177 domain-containing protein [Clostridia bacterium]|nr:DUF177 domain-containing protein [Clostridia bacterium]